MKTCAYLFCSAGLIVLPVQAGDQPVYRCSENGRTIFSEEPTGKSCELLDLEVPQPDPAEVERLELKKRLDAAREQQERESADRERLLRAQEDAARATERLAETQRRLAEQRLREAQQPPPPANYGYPPLWVPNYATPPGIWPPYQPLPPYGIPPPGPQLPPASPPPGGTSQIVPKYKPR